MEKEPDQINRENIRKTTEVQGKIIERSERFAGIFKEMGRKELPSWSKRKTIQRENIWRAKKEKVISNFWQKRSVQTDEFRRNKLAWKVVLCQKRWAWSVEASSCKRKVTKNIRRKRCIWGIVEGTSALIDSWRKETVKNEKERSSR